MSILYIPTLVSPNNTLSSYKAYIVKKHVHVEYGYVNGLCENGEKVVGESVIMFFKYIPLIHITLTPKSSNNYIFS